VNRSYYAVKYLHLTTRYSKTGATSAGRVLIRGSKVTTIYDSMYFSDATSTCFTKHSQASQHNLGNRPAVVVRASL